MAGYSFGDVDRKRNATATGSTDSDMWYAALNGEYRMPPSSSVPLELVARLECLWARKTVHAFTESDGSRAESTTADVSQVKPGLEASYSFGGSGTTLQRLRQSIASSTLPTTSTMPTLP